MRVVLLVLVALTACEIRALAADHPRVDFVKQVRPILAERCFGCHGPEEQQSNLRLDQRTAARKGGDGGLAIKPGMASSSRLVTLIESPNADERMPLGKKPLTAEQTTILKRWIDEGADWPDAWSGEASAARAAHWSFRSPTRPPLPSVRNTTWPRNGIDYFVMAKLEQSGLSPSSEADRSTLARRVAFDLLGLPPTLEEADEFLQDARPDAYERYVDSLLASPRYGERWARRWLDLARYADTNGYEKDRPRTIWPYRDWVVRALNADMPFDQFTIRQLAGDRLPNATADDRIATGFHRNTMQNEEGGIDPLEFRFHAMVDRVHTTSTTWLGLTLACAQCHTHKYDPFPQREYYQVMAFLNNCDEIDLDVPDALAARRRDEVSQRLAVLEAGLKDRFPVQDDQDKPDSRPLVQRRRELVAARFAEWSADESKHAAAWTVLHPMKATSNLPLLTVLDDDSVLASGDQTKSDVYDLTLRATQRGITAIRLEVLPHESLPLRGPGRAYYEGPKGDFFLSEIRATVGGRDVKFKTASHSYSKLSIGGGEHGAQLTFDGNTTTGWSTNGREGEPHAAVFQLAEPIDGDGELTVRMIFERHFACGLGRFRIAVTQAPQAVTARGHSAEIEAILAKPATERSLAEGERLFARFLQVAPELAEPRAEIQKLRDALPKPVSTLVMAERPANHSRPTHVHHRGEFLQPKEAVSPEVPAVLPQLAADVPRNRLTFARWLVAKENPLTARVTVNRQWQVFFGRGLVRTVEDFGLQGEPPSHAELLDWLAMEFGDVGSGDSENWSLKQLHRRIVTSATYRQAAHVSETLATRDPLNVLLARGPRVRLEAEQIRDAALLAAGLLSHKMGGPGVYPPQPASITTEGTYGALPWKASDGEDRYRRTLYTFMKRTAPFAMSATFDAPSGEACLARREVSNSPLQSLTLLNDTIFLEASRALGTVLAQQQGDDHARLDIAFRRCLTRPPTDEESTTLLRFVQTQRERFAAGKLDPRKFTADGDGNLVERATWTTLAHVLFNLDEMITK